MTILVVCQFQIKPAVGLTVEMRGEGTMMITQLPHLIDRRSSRLRTIDKFLYMVLLAMVVLIVVPPINSQMKLDGLLPVLQ